MKTFYNFKVQEDLFYAMTEYARQNPSEVKTPVSELDLVKAKEVRDATLNMLISLKSKINSAESVQSEGWSILYYMMLAYFQVHPENHDKRLHEMNKEELLRFADDTISWLSLRSNLLATSIQDLEAIFSK